VFAEILGGVNDAGALALVAAAVFATRATGAWRGARIGLRVLAVLAVLEILIPLPLGLLSPDALQSVATAWYVQGILFQVFDCGVGIGIAWPWLAPKLDRAARAATRARDRWVDTTP
jgi:hypothetical protein